MKTLLTALSIALAAALGVAGCASSPENKRDAGQFTDDAALTAKVKTAIATDVGARAASAINVETFKGVVQLSGFVDNSEAKSTAEQLARAVDNVKSVDNEIDVKK
jgi:osmotically-inducible protein OsmY